MTNEEAIKQLKGYVRMSVSHFPKDLEALDMAINALKEAKTGQWIEYQKHFTCNHCESQIAKEYFSNFDFCPWCGANMRGNQYDTRTKS